MALTMASIAGHDASAGAISATCAGTSRSPSSRAAAGSRREAGCRFLSGLAHRGLLHVPLSIRTSCGLAWASCQAVSLLLHRLLSPSGRRCSCVESERGKRSSRLLDAAPRDPVFTAHCRRDEVRWTRVALAVDRVDAARSVAAGPGTGSSSATFSVDTATFDRKVRNRVHIRVSLRVGSNRSALLSFLLSSRSE